MEKWATWVAGCFRRAPKVASAALSPRRGALLGAAARGRSGAPLAPVQVEDGTVGEVGLVHFCLLLLPRLSSGRRRGRVPPDVRGQRAVGEAGDEGLRGLLLGLDKCKILYSMS